ncbi:MAG: sulfite exporter TauE/SafE family protein [Chitinophagaceae bacterium]|nr:MAG: sulfite exporter TauE/SafE family protein [Chitinophagaceae bacterium]
MELAAYFIAVLIGISLGLIGGGGSILTVPVLVYMLHVDPLVATTYSLFIVGITSLVGGARAYTRRLVDFRAVSLFGIPSILAIFIARHFILPAIPEYIFSFGNISVTKGVLLMVVFAVLMFLASLSMIRKERTSPEDEAGESGVTALHLKTEPNLWLILPGLAIGLLTGLLGAGGGFLIIPTLVLIIRMPMKTAVGTSLIIIAINSIFGFVFSLNQYYLDWSLMLIFTVLAIAGIFIGTKLSEKIPGETLRRGFGWFVLVMGIYILLRELIFVPS